jgi:hypothetical protein
MSVNASPPPIPTSLSRKKNGATKLETMKRSSTFPGLMRPSGM